MIHIGTRGPYSWLTTTDSDASELLHICPSIVTGNYVVVTSFDSGSPSLRSPYAALGWRLRGGLAHSKEIQSPEGIPLGGYDEFYIFDTENTPLDTRSVRFVNPFEHTVDQYFVDVFVNFGVFALHDPQWSDLSERFWDQLVTLSPRSFVADGMDHVTFVTHDHGLFEEVYLQLLRNAENERATSLG